MLVCGSYWRWLGGVPKKKICKLRIIVLCLNTVNTLPIGARSHSVLSG